MKTKDVYVLKLETLLVDLFDAHYGFDYHDCGNRDGLETEDAAEIVEAVKAIRAKQA